MSLQFIQDTNGNTKGVFIPIEEWQSLKDTHTDLRQKEAENIVELSAWQKQIIDERIKDYYQNPDSVLDFDKTIDDIKKACELYHC